MRSDSQTLVYMDGYVFVEFRPAVNYLRLRETTYFREVLCTRSSRGSSPAYSLVEDAQLDTMRKGMEEVRENKLVPGDPVVVKSGVFRGLRCVVLDVDGDMISVKMDYRSKPLIMAYASTYLDKIVEK